MHNASDEKAVVHPPTHMRGPVTLLGRLAARRSQGPRPALWCLTDNRTGCSSYQLQKQVIINTYKRFKQKVQPLSGLQRQNNSGTVLPRVPKARLGHEPCRHQKYSYGD